MIFSGNFWVLDARASLAASIITGRVSRSAGSQGAFPLISCSGDVQCVLACLHHITHQVTFCRILQITACCCYGSAAAWEGTSGAVSADGLLS
jgi:hypothetical protein